MKRAQRPHPAVFLCDVNSFAPRCYIEEKTLDALVTNNKHFGAKRKRFLAVKVGARYFDAILSTTSKEGTKNWYKRDDSSNWRAVASHLLSKIAPPPWFEDAVSIAASKPTPFHFDRRYRNMDKERKKQQTRLHWWRRIQNSTSAKDDIAKSLDLNLDRNHGTEHEFVRGLDISDAELLKWR